MGNVGCVDCRRGGWEGGRGGVCKTVPTFEKQRLTNERIVIERQIEATDREIDRLVYELYELTEEEIALVEGATA